LSHLAALLKTFRQRAPRRRRSAFHASILLEASPSLAPHSAEMSRNQISKLDGMENRPAIAGARLRSFRSASGNAGLATSLARRVSALIAHLRTFWQRAQQRHELAQLHDEQLRDVGLDRRTVERERRKPFWRP
jgi:uncharacterized protein YjiS (DUF1127 family)